MTRPKVESSENSASDGARRRHAIPTGQARHLDPDLLPATPGDCFFLLGDAELDRDGDVAQGLTELGFKVAHTRSLAAPPCAMTIVLASVGTLANPGRPALPPSGPSSFVVAYAVPGDLAGGIAARRAGAHLVLGLPLSLPRLIAELAGVAWMPRRPYRVLLIDVDRQALDDIASLLRGAGCEVMAQDDPLAACVQAAAFGPEICVLGDTGSHPVADVLAVLRESDVLGAVPAVRLADDADGQADAGMPDVHLMPRGAAADRLVPQLVALARGRRALESASRQRRLLQRQYAELRDAVDAHAIVSVGAADGTILEVNPKFCEVSGYTPDELIGRNHRVVKSGRHPRAFFEAMWQTISSGKVWHGEVQNRRRDGSPYWVQGTIVPICDEHGLPLRYVSIRTEITAQKAVLAERERQGRLLNAIRQSLQRFIVDRDLAATSSLLLDAILSITDSVFGFIGEVQQDADGNPFLRAHAISNIAWSPDSRRLQEMIQNGGLEMRNLNSLYGAALTSGAPVISNDPANDPRHNPLPPGHPPLDAFLGLPIRHGESLIGLVGLANRAGGYDEDIIELLAPLTATYGAIVEAARLRALQQGMIENLRSEREAGEQAGRAATQRLAGWRRDFRNGLNAIVGHAQIMLLDDQLDSEAAEQAREIVRGGEILTSEFEALIDGLEWSEPLPATIAAPPAVVQPPSSAPPRILVAEDNPANQAVLRMQLELLGHGAEIAGDGAVALAKWRAGGFDLILADRNMPGMDGLALTRAIRASERASGKHVPIIAITAANHPGELALCLEAGMDDALSKPIELDQLRGLVERWLPRHALAKSEPGEGGPGESGAVLDTGYLARILGNVAPEQLRELVDLFTTTVHADLPECRRLLGAGNGRGLGLAMHRLKSSARMVGALRFAGVAEALEAAANEDRLDCGTSLLAELEHAVTDVEAAVLRVAVAPAPTFVARDDETRSRFLPRRVLVVDDDPMARHQLDLLLAALGVGEVRNVDGGIAALAELATPGAVFDLLITDLNMPGMDGIEFLRRLVEIDFRGHVILCSGVKDRLLHTAADLTRTKGLRLLGTLKKPARREALLELLANPRDEIRDKALPMESVAVSPQDISEGIRRDEFDVQFQPKVDAHTLRIVGVEALARWTHQGRAIPPDVFIRAAERHGLIAPLSEVLVTKALIGGARMAEAGFPLQMAINLSASWLAEVRLPEFIMATIQATGFHPENLVVEVTETGVLADIPTSMDVMTRLRLKGFKLSIDDFGIGYSSMEQLQRFPFGELKLDRAFVQGGENPTTRAILASTLDMARKLKLTTVAEGVETQAELDLVRGLGCDLVQGWLVAPSMRLEDLIEWVRAREVVRR